MADSTENTFTAYLGPEFQQRLMWQLLVEPEFAEKTIPNLAIEYFDDPNLKRLFIIMLEYFKEYEKVPNLQNQSIHQAINKYKTPNNLIEEESLFSVIKRITLWNERILNKEMLHDGSVVQKETNTFIKQQEWRKFAEFILDKTKSGEIRRKHVLGEIDEKIQKISHIGDEEDYGTEVIDNIEKALRKEFRQPIPTGVDVLDAVTGGGLGKGEIGVILTPSGVGKTTLLTKIANYAYEAEKNVLQVIFEDTTEQIQRKHYAIWSKVPLSKMDDEEENKKAFKICNEKAESMKGKGVLLIKRFSQENTTMLDIRNWMIRHQKKTGIKFDILILDYLDCLESHKKTPDRTEAELQIIKSFEALASDFDIPAWTAIQSNRSGFDSQYVEAHQIGGSIKRIQKAHLFMSVAKTKEQKEAQLANIRIIKARFAQDGQTFDDAIFNNDTMEIRIEDSRYKYAQVNKYAKHYGEKDIENLEEKNNEMTKIHTHLSDFEGQSIEKVNDIRIADVVPDKNAEYKEAFNSMYNNSNGNDNTVSGDIEKVPILKDFIMNNENVYPLTEKPNDDILEIDTENDGISEGVNEGVNNNDDAVTDTVNDTENTNIEQTDAETIAEIERLMKANVDEAPFEWNGESGATTNEIVVQPEVKIEDIKPEPIFEAKNTQLIDPDEEKSHPSVFKMLEEYRRKQGNIRKE